MASPHSQGFDTGPADRTPGPMYESPRTRVTRLAGPGPGGTVVHKQPLGPGAEQRRRHEATILARLAGVDGVVQVVEAAADVIVLEDLPGATLSTVERMNVTRLLEVAYRLAEVVAAVHRCGVVHKDINPANIILGPDDVPTLVDFELATTFAEERPSFIHQSQIAGTLAYIAPEQTGRTGGAVDQRADLYSLGATLYELATGDPPFGRRDPLHLIHDHLAEVPRPPVEVNPSLTRSLSDIILRLLEKEPDRRYQSAEGLAHDLDLARRRPEAADAGELPLGERDFPLRLTPPSRLIGRDGEINALRDAFHSSVRGAGRAVLINGGPGVGKTALIDQLRPAVAAGRGWFVTGKFDQNRSDVTADAVAQAMRALGRLLLAEPEATLAQVRPRIAEALGSAAGLVASMLPEIGVLLGVAAEEMSADESEARLIQVGLDLMRAIVAPDRPVVMVVDDLQWGTAGPIGFIDALVMDDSLTGLLIVGAYREAEVDAAHPLSAVLSRWERLGCAPPRIHLQNLPPSDLGLLLEEMLRLRVEEAGELVDALAARTGGNPYDTVELVNALRRDGVLVPGMDGWGWSPRALRGYVGEGDVVDLLSARIDRLPAPTRSMLEAMACLANEVDLALLRAATGESLETVEEWLTPALEDGLLIMEHPVGQTTGDGSVRFRHDRIQQAAYGRLQPDRRQAVELALARRLADRPGFELVAAQQYLAAVAGIDDRAERRRVVELFRVAAARTHLINYVATEQFLAGSMRLLTVGGADQRGTEGDIADGALRALVETEWHAALYALGRLDDADDVYRAIERRDPDPLTLTRSACVQISSLASRGRTTEAVTLGLGLLARLGLRVPRADELAGELEARLDALYEWAAAADVDADLRRADIGDARMAAAAMIINRSMPPAFFSDHQVMAWLITEACRLWAEYGPHAALVCPIGHAGLVTVAARQDYRTGYGAVRHVLRVSEARGYEPETSQARFLYAVSIGHWFEPLEEDIQQARQAHEGLVRAGDLLFACFTYHASTPSMLDTASTLDSYVEEVEAGITFAARTGNEQTTASSWPFRQLVRALRAAADVPAPVDEAFDAPAYLSSVDAHPMAMVYHHITRALAAALFDDADGLTRSSADAMPMLAFIQCHYATARAHLLRALALAHGIRAADGDVRPRLLRELDACRDWLARRAVDAPANFGHLVRLIDAERAWALDDPLAAAVAFDAAMEEVAPRRRPWQQALITERAALFHIGCGLARTGRALLAEAADHYRSWGADAKVRQLESAFPFLRARPESPLRGHDTGTTIGMSLESIDLLGVLKASQALSSETNLDRLRHRVVDVLRTMTGAATVQVVLHGDDAWYLPDDGTGAPVPVAEAAERGLIALSAFRYAERTRKPLLVEDATLDDRFARDPYLAGAQRCSLLVVPILGQGTLRAVILLENRLTRNVFTADRLDAVMLIAGQLGVCVDNAMLYASLERKVADRTEELEIANQKLQALSITDPLTGLANRRRMAELLDTEWQRGLRSGRPVAAAMIDIDHFKPYNDHYGHLAGDTCLRRVAGAIHEAVRTNDLVARYGGEEFAIILPDGDLAAARVVADRVRTAVLRLEEPHVAAPAGTVTVSIGVACTVPTSSTLAEDLIRAADAQLYLAKRNGRNRVASGEPGPAQLSPQGDAVAAGWPSSVQETGA